MTIFLNTLGDDVAGTVVLSLPPKGDLIEGYLTEDPAIQLKNNWEALIPDLGFLNDFSNLAGFGSKSWIGTTQASWKGTEPIVIDLNFYLITCRKKQITSETGTGMDMPVSIQATKLAQLAAIDPDGGGSGKNGDMFDTINVGIHGGYKPQVFARNEEFDKKKPLDKINSIKDDLANMGGVGLSDDQDGTIQIVINGGGNRTAVFSKMLLESVTFNPSTVRTGYWEGNTFIKSKEPLYIKVSAKFRLSHAATVADVTRMFTGRSSI